MCPGNEGLGFACEDGDLPFDHGESCLVRLRPVNPPSPFTRPFAPVQYTPLQSSIHTPSTPFNRQFILLPVVNLPPINPFAFSPKAGNPFPFSLKQRRYWIMPGMRRPPHP